MKKLSICLTMVFLAALAFSTISCSGDDKASAPDQSAPASSPVATDDASLQVPAFEGTEDDPQIPAPVVEGDAPQAPDFMDDAHRDIALNESLGESLDEARPILDEELKAQVEEGVIRMANPAYETHTRPIMNFFHERHYLQFNVSCGQCHHDEQGKPLNDLKEGDSVKSCIDCHSIPGQMPRDQKTALQNLPEEERLQKELAFHAEAIHKLCTDCHRARNQEQGKSTRDGAPTTCAQCHVRE
jgi:hypothetical protein